MDILLVIFFLILPVYGYNSVLTELSIKAGPRGLILIVKTNRPIDDSFQNIIQASTSQVDIKLFNVSYGLDKLSFTNITENSPIKKIEISENNSHIQLHIGFHKEIKNKIKTKYKENNIHYFLSSASYTKIDWTYSTKKKDKIYSLNKIELIQDGNIEKLIIPLDSTVKVRTQNRKDAIIAVFENSINGFSQSVFTLPDNSLFKKVIIKESFHDGLNIVGLILYKSALSISPALIHREALKFSFYTVQNDLSLKDHLVLWSSDNLNSIPYTVKTRQKVSESIYSTDSAGVTKKKLAKTEYKKKIGKEKLKKDIQSNNILKKDAFVQSVEKITQIPRIVAESEEKFKKMTHYRIYGRDPYLPLNNPEFIESDLPNIEQCKLVGILFDENIKIALIEHLVNGEAFALKENSDILNGRVLKINRKNVTFLLNSTGYSQRYVMNLQSKNSKDQYEKKISEQ